LNQIPSTFRDIRVQVLDIHGKPAANQKVDLVGLERWSMEPSADQAAKFWHFVTDEKGNVVVPIGDFAGWEGNEVHPGWGVYAHTVVIFLRLALLKGNNVNRYFDLAHSDDK
jgi:hypothetical protein